MPLRGKQPHERVREANWWRSLCAAKRPARAFKAAGHLRAAHVRPLQGGGALTVHLFGRG